MSKYSFDELKKEAKTRGLEIPNKANNYTYPPTRVTDDDALLKNIILIRSDIRQNRTWLVALISAIASILSAAAAIIAVLTSN